MALVACWLMFALAVSIPVFAGRQQRASVSSWLAMLHLTDCAIPCWIGIWPGKTTGVEARALLNKVYGAELRNYSIAEHIQTVFLSNREHTILIGMRMEDGIVNEIEFRIMRDGTVPPSGDIIYLKELQTMIGSPRLAYRSDYTFGFSYGPSDKPYGTLHGKTESNVCYFAWEQLNLYTPGFISNTGSWMPWSGFQEFAPECRSVANHFPGTRTNSPSSHGAA
jgi:hypothetical protein